MEPHWNLKYLTNQDIRKKERLKRVETHQQSTQASTSSSEASPATAVTLTSLVMRACAPLATLSNGHLSFQDRPATATSSTIASLTTFLAFLPPGEVSPNLSGDTTGFREGSGRRRVASALPLFHCLRVSHRRRNHKRHAPTHRSARFVWNKQCGHRGEPLEPPENARGVAVGCDLVFSFLFSKTPHS